MIGLGRVCRQVERRENRAEEQPGAEFARNKIGMLALPAETGGCSERLFHHGGGIDKDLHVAAALRNQPARQLPSAAA